MKEALIDRKSSSNEKNYKEIAARVDKKFKETKQSLVKKFYWCF